MADKPIWEILPGETDGAFAAFRIYLSLGPERSMRAVEEKINAAKTGRKEAKRVPSGKYTAWAKKYRWPERARAYDDHMARATSEAVIRGTADRLAQFNNAAFGIALLAFNKVKTAIDNHKGEVPPSVWAPLLSVADKVARLALDAPTDNLSNNLRVSLESLKGEGLVSVIADPVNYDALQRIAEGIASKHAQRAN